MDSFFSLLNFIKTFQGFGSVIYEIENYKIYRVPQNSRNNSMGQCQLIRHSRSFWDRVGYDHLVILLAVPR
jgi:hypothetical protein